MKLSFASAALVCAIVAGPAAARADDAIDWVVKVGVHSVDPNASVNGTKVDKVHIDPFVYGVAVGYRF